MIQFWLDHLRAWQAQGTNSLDPDERVVAYAAAKVLLWAKGFRRVRCTGPASVGLSAERGC